MTDQIPESVKAERSDVLLELEAKMSKTFRESLIGQRTEVLLEEKITLNGVDYMIGHTMEYVKVVVPYREGLKNTMVSGVLTGMRTDEIMMLS